MWNKQRIDSLSGTRKTGNNSEPLHPLTTMFPKPVVNPDGQNDKLIECVRVVRGSLENLAESE
jgi:hypothetical protein